MGLLGGGAGLLAQQRTPAAAPAPADLPALSVRAAGAIGDGRADDSAAFRSAYQQLDRAGGGTLLVPRGAYRASLELTSRRVHLRGEGRGVSVLAPPAPGSPALRALHSEPSWDAVQISDLSVRGLNGRGIGLVCGGDRYRRHDEYVGRILLQRVGFAELDRCVVRPYGNIGLYIDGCTFGPANYHLWTATRAPREADPMHGGAMVVSRSHFTGFAEAAIYLESPAHEGGQVVFTDNVFELAEGFVLYVRGFAGAGGVPGITFARNWNEQTATGRAIEVEGQAHARASFLHARNSMPILFEDTPLGSVDLAGTSVETRNCALDNLLEAQLDQGSQLVHHQARQFSGLAPGLCRSIAGPTGPRGLRTPWFRMPLPGNFSRAFADAVLQRFDASGPIEFTGNRRARSETVADAALPGQAAGQQLTLEPGDTLWPAPGFAVGANRWLVTLYLYRRMAGPPVGLQLTGQAGLSGEARLAADGWEMLVNVSENASGAQTGEGLWHRADRRARTTVRIGGLAVLAFPDRQRAIDFTNANLFPA